MALLTPSTLTTWEDAFAHPLPTIRHLETQLQNSITSNRSTLRSLVGTSYRDLLSTAERIIEMNAQVQTVERALGDVGRKCNARVLERVEEERRRMRGAVERGDKERGRRMVQTRLLGRCLVGVGRGVRRGEDALGVVKGLVLARVLFKSVSSEEEGGNVVGVVRELGGRLARARGKVAAYLERVVGRTVGEKGGLVNALCAYALVTSSTPKEVLRYFLQVRLQRLESMAEAPSEQAVVEMLELYNQTVLDSRELFPRRFADALGQLAKAPLLQDEQVRGMAELNIDVYGSWIAADIKTFTPWVRHEQLTSTEVAEALASWTTHAQECVLDGLQEYLQSQEDARAVVSARQKIMSRYLGVSGKIPSSNHREAIDGVRLAFLEKVKLLATKAGKVPEIFESSQRGASIAGPTTSIWDLATKHFDLSHGAIPFRNAIIHQRHGRDESVDTAIQSLDIWTANIHAILELIDEMRNSRWDDDIDLDLDDLDDKDALITHLSKNDPEAVLTTLRDSTLRSLETLAENVTSESLAPEDAACHLRIWREIEKRRSSLHTQLDLPQPLPNLTPLYRSLSQHISHPAVEKYLTAVGKATYIPTKLWDGSPPLPTQPLPATFRFLVQVQKGMSEVGEDLWCLGAVREVKGVLVSGVKEGLEGSEFTNVGGGGEGVGNGIARHDDDGGDGEEDENTTSSIDAAKNNDHNRLIQNLFETLYLQRAFHGANNHDDDDNGLDGIITAIRTTVDLDDTAFERLRKSAGEYWKRTYLLFGLLAPAREGEGY